MSSVPLDRQAVNPQIPTPTTARRELRFASMMDLLREVESFQNVPVESLGKWTPAQNIDHVRRLIRVSHAGTEMKLPLALRALGRLLRSRILSVTFKPGLKTIALFEPPADITLDEAIADFREDIRLASIPGAMSQPSPLLGKITHDQWEQLHCRHAELHFGFIVPIVEP